MSQIVAPFGSWDTPITPDVIASANVRLSFPAFARDGSFVWLEGRPSEQGRQTVVSARRDGHREDLVPAPFSARTRVHEYGGLSYVLIGSDVVFVHDADQHLYRAAPDHPVAPLGEPSPFRIAEPLHDSIRDRLIAVGELHGASGRPENGLVTVDLASGRVDWLARGHDFFAAPAISPAGDRLAYLAWDYPDMPWDAASVHVAQIKEDGSLGASQRVAGGRGGSAFQPLWSPSGELFFALESDSLPWTLHRWTEAGGIEPIAPSQAEWGAPLWNLGTTLYGFASAREIVASIMERGMSRLVKLDLETGSMVTLADGLGYVGQLAVSGRDVLFTVGWAGSGGASFFTRWVGGGGDRVSFTSTSNRVP